MPFLAALLAPLLLVPGQLHGDDGRAVGAAQMLEVPGRAPGDLSERIADWLSLDPAPGADTAEQVRIESRVILRIVPRPMPSRSDLIDQFEPTPTRVVEGPSRKCLAMRDIAAVADRGKRLMLFLRDNRVLVASLEKTCSPRDFYRGFYLEKSEDGMMCAGRDRLMSRAGAKCQLEGMRELVSIPSAR